MSEKFATRPSGGERGPAPLSFSFDARHKSVVPQVLDEEARRLRRFFSRKPKVSLHQLEEALRGGAPGADQVRKLLAGFTTAYRNHEHGHQFMESAARILLEAAARERSDGARQRALLRMAHDTVETAIRRTPKKVNVSAQSVLVAICKILGKEMHEQYYVEREVHKEMAAMLNVRKDPNDFVGRERIIKLYLQGHRYYEALVHLAEYEKIMQAKSRPLYHQKKGDIAFRKAQVFQAIIDNYYRLGGGSESKGREGERTHDVGQLSAFIQRFNRDNRFNITPLKGQGPLALQKTLSSMVTIANNFYAEASKAPSFQAKHRPLFLMARNNYLFDNSKRAVQNLAEGIRLLDLSRVPVAQRNGEKLRLLEFQHRIFAEQNQTRKAEEVMKQITRLRREQKAPQEPQALGA